MLHVFKHKMKQERVSAETAPGTTGDSATGVRIVSHVPLPDSKASDSVSSLSDNSLNSSQFHPFQPLTRHGDHETWDGRARNCPNTSTSTLKTTVTAETSELVRSSSTTESKSEKRPVSSVTTAPQRHGFARTISMLSVDASEGPDLKRRRTESTTSESPEPQLKVQPRSRLLHTPKDASVLSPLHIFVRQQVEVFEATEEDLKQPAPGRRIPIQLNQGKTAASC